MPPRRALLLALVPACTALDDDAAGKPAGDCSRDPVCLKVQDALQIVRDNIGGRSGTPDNIAQLDIFEVGPPAIPHLARALHAREPEVAAFAAYRLVDLAARDRADTWCASTRNPACPDIRAYADSLVGLDVAGTWSGYRNSKRDEDDAFTEHTLTLTLHGASKRLRGQLCIDPSPCVPLDHAEFAGARLALDYRLPAGRETMTLLFEDGELLGRGTIIKCPDCLVGIELERKP